MDFREADRRYAEIKRRHEAGALTDEEFDEQLEQLMVQDQEDRWWSKARRTGEWHRFTGTTWVKDTPPGYEQPQAAPEDQPEIQESESLTSTSEGFSRPEQVGQPPPATVGSPEESPTHGESTPDPLWLRVTLAIVVITVLLLFFYLVIALGL